MHAKSDSDVTSLAPSSPPRSPKRQAYYVQSPSRDSHDGDKSSSIHATPVYNSPMESPSHPSYSRHSRTSSASRFSGTFGRKGGEKVINEKGWPECNVIEEEGAYDGLDDEKRLTRRCRITMAVASFVILFTVLCLIIWGASRPYKPQISVRSLSVNNFYAGEGSDSTGVPTKMVTSNFSLSMSIYNPAATFGIHVTSGPINLMFSEIAIATGQLKQYYQPSKSHRSVAINLQGEKVPLYGAGSSLSVSSTGGTVPLTLDLEITTRAYVVGQLVKVKHQRFVSCSITVDSTKNNPVKFSQDSCTYT